MKIIEGIVDRLMEVHLFEMAFQRKNIVERCKNLQMQIAIHVIKCSVWSDNEARHHWESEINNWIGQINDMFYDRHKKLSYETYFDLLWVAPFEHTPIVRRRANGSDGLPKVNLSSDELASIENKIKAAYDLVCEELSMKDSVMAGFSGIKQIFSKVGI